MKKSQIWSFMIDLLLIKCHIWKHVTMRGNDEDLWSTIVLCLKRFFTLLNEVMIVLPYFKDKILPAFPVRRMLTYDHSYSSYMHVLHGFCDSPFLSIQCKLDSIIIIVQLLQFRVVPIENTHDNLHKILKPTAFLFEKYHRHFSFKNACKLITSVMKRSYDPGLTNLPQCGSLRAFC